MPLRSSQVNCLPCLHFLSSKLRDGDRRCNRRQFDLTYYLGLLLCIYTGNECSHFPLSQLNNQSYQQPSSLSNADNSATPHGVTSSSIMDDTDRASTASTHEQVLSDLAELYDGLSTGNPRDYITVYGGKVQRMSGHLDWAARTRGQGTSKAYSSTNRSRYFKPRRVLVPRPKLRRMWKPQPFQTTMH